MIHRLTSVPHNDGQENEVALMNLNTYCILLIFSRHLPNLCGYFSLGYPVCILHVMDYLCIVFTHSLSLVLLLNIYIENHTISSCRPENHFSLSMFTVLMIRISFYRGHDFSILSTHTRFLAKRGSRNRSIKIWLKANLCILISGLELVQSFSFFKPSSQ
jgi:hypothetical protein